MSNKTTFLSFAQNKKIEIPIFQRDYAQGRNDHMTDKIRKDFVSSLIEALDKNTPIELDFIYGREVDNTITLIDGQQRLTTLFLLHWYISQRIGKIDAFKNIKFSYATRDYAKDFTAKLTTEEDFKIDFTQAISTELKDKNWFYDDWKHDPTVSGMLNTLDEIHKQLRGKTIEHYWSLLEQGIITFYWLDLEEHQLTDELYLKMNARGKQLSNFENFKASLVKHITDNGWEKNTPEKDSFSFKMDTIYTDLFWEYRGEVNVIDYEVTNFFAGMAMIGYALKENSEAQQKRIQELFNNPLSVRVEDFEKSDFERFTSYLDFYSAVENISIETELWKYYNTDNKRGLFEEFIKDENKETEKKYDGATYPQRVLFYALSELFMKSEDKNNISEDFIRVIRNIVENATIDSAQTFVGAIKLMSELLEGVQDIYWYLSKTAIQSNFASYQVTQEKQKAERIVANPEWKDIIWEAENHPMFKGDIGFLLLETENDLSLFKKRYEVAKEMFDEEGVKGKYRENALLIRALVSRFDNWGLFWNLNYDSTAYNWKTYILRTVYKEKDNAITKHFLTLLDKEDKLEQFITEDSPLKEENEHFELRKKTHENLYQTELLAAICEQCYLRWEYDNYILYPYNSHTEKNKYIVTSESEAYKKLLQTIVQRNIPTEQRLEWNSKKLPFLWGRNINFSFNGKEYLFKGKGFNRITQNGQDCTEEILKIFE
jgi:hypothetical protein